ncbi:MAG: zinc ABC transporter solute-binding protein [Gammaproteobacteria bacterium]|nr:zinc ABC transporter solute-binding protein [Gammaproteobacteria bacterium]NIR98616.1 zinc ABC transporter solute-binding protein [Gammaproteobacteria bacterium]NIT64339.1 zinc ABC transporter solute-binding protein [Gammaproteobacteria bacterium]NIV21263.1 zinc ABC transporter solute-binding protein [Gammaproteobacteria bacterium]NIX10967.1 zinc ABC transporter solute-binding protein [Gammaproteobacteria bacterium]
MTRILAFLALTALALPAAALDVFACEPEWAALTEELAGARARVRSATTALQDPHHIQARPSLIAQLRRADLVVCTGAGLEAGWLPVLQRRANNPKVLAGRAGYFEAAAHVRLLDVPARLDRAEGDIHPQGNPHLHTDPRNVLQVARALAQRLAAVDPPGAPTYRAHLEDFEGRWRAAMARWERSMAELRGLPVVTQHRGWVYLIDWLGLREVACLEPKPGIPPSSAHLGEVLRRLEEEPARMVIRAAYQEPRAAQWLAQRTGLPIVVLPYTVGGSDGAGDLFGLFDETMRRLRGAAR